MPYTALTDLFSDIADAIRAKKGSSSLIVATDFPSEISTIPTGGGGGTDVSDTTATADKVLDGYKFHVANGTLTTGNIPTIALPSPTLTRSGGTITATETMGEGYTAGGTTTGTLTLTTQAGSTTTPTTSAQTIVAANTFCTGAIKVGAIPNQVAGGTTTPTTSEQTIVAANSYVTSAVKVAAIPNQVAGGTTTPTTSAQTIVTAGHWVTSDVKVGAIPNQVAGGTTTPTTSVQTIVTANHYVTSDVKVAAIPNQTTGGTKYATTSDQTLITAPKYVTSNITLKKLTQTNLTAANIKNGVTVKVNNGNADVWSVTGTCPIRYSYSNSITPSATKSFTCTSNAGVSSLTAYYVSFNPGFTPTVILCVCKTQTLFRASYDSRMNTYVLVNESGNYYACSAGWTISSSSCIIPVIPNWDGALEFYVSAWA